MPTTYHNKVYDAGLDYVKANANKLVLCKAAPTTYAEANNLPTDTPAGFKIAEVAIAPTDLIIAARTGGGREITSAIKNGVVSLASSIASDNLHYGYINTVGSELLVVLNEPSDQPVTAPNPINFPSNKIGFSAPA